MLPPSTIHRCGSPHLQAGGRCQQRTWAADAMVKSCSGERLKKSILVQILLNKEPSLFAGLSQTAFGGNRNPEKSGGIWRNPVQIQEFLSCRNSCEKLPWKRKKTEFSRPHQNHIPVRKFLQKKLKKRNPQESWHELVFGVKKNRFPKKGIGNLGWAHCCPQMQAPVPPPWSYCAYCWVCQAELHLEMPKLSLGLACVAPIASESTSVSQVSLAKFSPTKRWHFWPQESFEDSDNIYIFGAIVRRYATATFLWMWGSRLVETQSGTHQNVHFCSIITQNIQANCPYIMPCTYPQLLRIIYVPEHLGKKLFWLPFDGSAHHHWWWRC